jgi:hypothetical protein
MKGATVISSLNHSKEIGMQVFTRASLNILTVGVVLAFGAVACNSDDVTKPTGTVSDSFDRANATPIAGNWTTSPALPAWGTLALVSNQVVPTNAAADGEAYYSGMTWPDDQYSKAKLYVTGTGGLEQGIGLLVRQSTSAVTHYRLVVDHASSGNVALGKHVAGAYTTLATYTQSWTDGAVWELRVTGTKLQIFLNGTQIGSDVTDISIGSGSAGIVYSATETSAAIDDWEGGRVTN